VTFSSVDNGIEHGLFAIQRGPVQTNASRLKVNYILILFTIFSIF